jgi:hypothetical protein
MRPVQAQIMGTLMRRMQGQQQTGSDIYGAPSYGPAPGGGAALTPADELLGNMVGMKFDDYNKSREIAQPKMILGPDGIYRNEKDSSYGGVPFVKVDAGQLAVPGANGGPEGVTNAPGSLGAQFRSTLATELPKDIASAATSLETPVVNGVPTPMSRLSAIRQSGGTGNQSIDAILGGTDIYGGPIVPQRNPAPSNSQAEPATHGIGPAPAAVPAPRRRPIQRGAAVTPPPAANPLQGVSADTQAYRTAQATDAATRFKQWQDGGQQAVGAISRLKMLDQLLYGTEGGKLAPLGYDVSSALNSMGFKTDPKLANKDAAMALQKSMAAEALKNPDTGANMFPRVTNFEYEQAQAQVPGLQQSAAGRHILVQMKVAENQRMADIAGMARKWNDRFGRIDGADNTGRHFQDYLDQWSTQHPLYAGIAVPGGQARR